MLDMYKVGRRIAAVRELRDMTQQQLADKAGVNQVTIARIETAKTKHVLLETMVAIAEALGVGVDDLVGRDDQVGKLLAAGTERAG